MNSHEFIIGRKEEKRILERLYRSKNFALTKSYSEELSRKKSLFQKSTKTKKGLFITLITPFGAKENEHFHNIVDHQISLEALFKQ